jgi:hypothetical protein
VIYAHDQQLAGVALVVDAKRSDGPLRTSAPLSQISAGVLSATTEQLSLVASLGHSADDARTPRFWMAAVLLEHGGEVLPELGTPDAAFAGSMAVQPMVLRIQSDGGRLLPGKSMKAI